MNDYAFRVLLSLYMVSDPWPLSTDDNVAMEMFLNEQASDRGFRNWIDAYHNFKDAEVDV